MIGFIVMMVFITEISKATGILKQILNQLVSMECKLEEISNNVGFLESSVTEIRTKIRKSENYSL